MNTDLREIKNRLNIVDVLGEYLRLEKAGANYRALCPFHNEKSPSFMVSEEKQMWHCFGCGKGGDIFSFVMEIEGLEFREALKILAEKAGVTLASYNPQKAEQKNRTLEILELATKFYEVQLWKGAGKTKIMDYLKDRGLNDETIKIFRLGYAPNGWRNVLSFLLERGFSIGEIERTGLLVKKEAAQISNSLRRGGLISNQCQNLNDQYTEYKKSNTNYYDRFRDRIIFPICDYSGKVLGYSARVAPGGDESQAKYVNSPETEVYHKSKILYGIDKAKGEIKQKDFALLVEGNMDVIASYQAGIKNVVAVSGTALTSDQLDILKRYTKNLKMLFDMDAAGEAATRKSIKLCLEKNISAQIVILSIGKDAADAAKNDPQKLLAAVAQAKSAMEYLFQKTFSLYDKNKVEDKKKISQSLLEIVESMSDAVEKSHWVKKLAAELDVAESALTDELKKVKLTNRISANEKNQAGEVARINNRQKIDILLEELAGLMLVSENIWEDILKKNEYQSYFSRDSLLDLMLKRGREFDFNFDKFSGAIDRETRSLAEKLFFRKKFRLGLNNSLEETPADDFQKELISILDGLKEEFKKIKLKQIAKDLKLAEERKDKDAVKFLQGELRKILS
ncbi:MAG TPA: hypothetical protein DCS28_01650 [Candidatus Moranbacteria bacterium]|nr:hypothetical protein [Candidatus Moranbacteria bacterium]HAT74729.1 hypothetical protein [Candidatus Moranbacteria bacterium]